MPPELTLYPFCVLQMPHVLNHLLFQVGDADSLKVAYRGQAPQVPALLENLRQQLLLGPARAHPLGGQTLHLQLLSESLPPALPPPAAHTVRQAGHLVQERALGWKYRKGGK